MEGWVFLVTNGAKERVNSWVPAEASGRTWVHVLRERII